MKSTRSLYHGHRYPREFISHAVWLYYRFGISLEMLRTYLPNEESWFPTKQSAGGARSSVSNT